MVALLARWLGGVRRSVLARNVVIVASGTAGAQVLTIVFAPVITRLYGPTAFGVYGTFAAVLAVAVPVTAFSYPIAIVLPKSDEEAIGIAKLSLLIAVTVAIVFSGLLVGFGAQFAALLNLEDLGALIVLVPVGMLFGVCAAVANQWVIRKELFRIKADAAIAQAVAVNGAKVGIGLLHPFGLVLVVVTSFSGLLHALLLLIGIRARRLSAKMVTEGSAITSLWELAKRHRDFPLYRSPQILLSTLSQSLPILMLASLFGPAAAGFYALALSVLALPMSLIGESVQSVFYPRINQAVLAGQSASELIARVTTVLALAGLVPFGTVVALAPSLFPFVFGSDWGTSGQYAQWLGIWSYMRLVNQPSVAAIPALALQRHLLVYEIMSSLTRVMALAVGFFIFANDLIAVALFSMASVLINAGLILFTLWAARRWESKNDEHAVRLSRARRH
jgi:O-antigen/teichoic acid export membrane protein